MKISKRKSDLDFDFDDVMNAIVALEDLRIYALD